MTELTDSNKFRQNDTVISVSNFTYYLYLLYTISFFSHMAARFPFISALRPDLLLAALIFISLILQLNKLTGRFNNPCNQYLFIFLIYLILSLPFVKWPGSVLMQNLPNFIKGIVFFYFTVLIVDTDLRLKRFVFVYMACQLFRVLEPLYLHVMYGYMGGATYIGEGEFTGRLSGAPFDVINPNGLGFVIATSFPFMHYLWGTSRWTNKISYLTLFPLLLYALVLTMSRSGLVATLVIAFYIFIESRHKVILIIVGIFIAALAWNNMGDLQKDRYLSLTGDTEVRSSATFQGRIKGMEREYAAAFEAPIVGHGLGTSQEALFNAAGIIKVSHTLYLETLLDTGIIGTIIFILFIKSIYDTLKQTAKNLSAPGKPDKKRNNKSQPEPINNSIAYEMNLQKALVSCFWMYLIFSFAQYGLLEYHWYILAGLATVLYIRSNNNITVPNNNYQ